MTGRRATLNDSTMCSTERALTDMFSLELDRYIGQPIYIGRYQGQADISYRCLLPIKYRV